MIPENAERIVNDGMNIIGFRVNGVDNFRGIPYAEAPVGELRFAPPVPKKKWTEALDCTEFGHKAVQDVPNKSMGGAATPDEDCLNLNIWAPAGAKPGDDYPVFVWIHGGGFYLGSGSQPFYDGSTYARQGIVIVTINYRLGALGFLSLDTLKKKYGTVGNWGTLDQIQALKWVNENIGKFGGDVKNITIGGESAGSFSCTNMILSPLAKGLFQRAILESGSLSYMLGENRQELDKCIKQGGEFAKLFDADDSEEGLKKLREADPLELWRKSPFLFDYTKPMPYMMAPVYDGVVLPKDPYRALKDGDFNKDIKVIAGSNDMEGLLFVSESKDKEADFKRIVDKAFGDNAEKALAYIETIDSTLEENLAGVTGMTLLSFGEFLVQEEFAKHGVDVYSYVYGYKSGKSVPVHGAEVAMVFEWASTVATDKMSPEDIEFGKIVQKYWINFMKTGNPNGDGLIKWPTYDKGEVIHLANTIEVGPRNVQPVVDALMPLYFHD